MYIEMVLCRKGRLMCYIYAWLLVLQHTYTYILYTHRDTQLVVQKFDRYCCLVLVQPVLNAMRHAHRLGFVLPFHTHTYMYIYICVCVCELAAAVGVGWLPNWFVSIFYTHTSSNACVCCIYYIHINLSVCPSAFGHEKDPFFFFEFAVAVLRQVLLYLLHNWRWMDVCMHNNKLAEIRRPQIELCMCVWDRKRERERERLWILLFMKKKGNDSYVVFVSEWRI